jgi:hypothetical protein
VVLLVQHVWFQSLVFLDVCVCSFRAWKAVGDTPPEVVWLFCNRVLESVHGATYHAVPLQCVCVLGWCWCMGCVLRAASGDARERSKVINIYGKVPAL